MFCSASELDKICREINSMCLSNICPIQRLLNSRTLSDIYRINTYSKLEF
jgi:hypothetical protein